MSTLTTTTLNTSYPYDPLPSVVAHEAQHDLIDFQKADNPAALHREPAAHSTTLPAVELHLWDERDATRGRSFSNGEAEKTGGTLREIWHEADL